MEPIGFQEKLRKKVRTFALIKGARAFLLAFLSAGVITYFLLIYAYCSSKAPAFPIPYSSFLFILLFAVPLLAALTVILVRQRDIRSLTLILERDYPRLRNRLLTLNELSEQRALLQKQPFSRALAKGLEQEMSALMERFSFTRASSARKLLLPALLLGGFFCVVCVHALIQPDFFITAYNRLMGAGRFDLSMLANVSKKKPPKFKMIVSPGNCEIAKGSTMVIQVQVFDYQAKRARLHFQEGRELVWRVIPMQQKDSRSFQHILSQATEPISYYVKVDHQRSPTFQIKLFEPLAIERAWWRLEFPEYMHLPEQRRHGWQEKITVPRGTKVHLDLQMNQPVEPGWLAAKSQTRIPLASVSPQNLEASFTVSEDLFLHLDVRNAKGESLFGLPDLWLQALPDLHPYVEVLEPQLHNYAFPTEEIPFEISANDDYGLSSVALILRYRGKEKRIEYLPKGQTPDTVVLKPILNLEEFPIQGRDLVFAYVEVQDNYPGEPAHIMRSPLFTFLIRQYVEQFKIISKEPLRPSIRQVFEDLLIEQEKITQETWEYLSEHPQEVVI